MQAAKDQAACCSICVANAKCQAAVFSGGQCYLKNGKTAKQHKKGVVACIPPAKPTPEPSEPLSGVYVFTCRLWSTPLSKSAMRRIQTSQHVIILHVCGVLVASTCSEPSPSSARDGNRWHGPRTLLRMCEPEKP